MKKAKVVVYDSAINGDFDDCQEQVTINGKPVFYCHDLSECPEDAVIGRNLFSADDFIDAVTLGMKLAAEGYNALDIESKTYKEWEEYDD